MCKRREPHLEQVEVIGNLGAKKVDKTRSSHDVVEAQTPQTRFVDNCGSRNPAQRLGIINLIGKRILTEIYEVSPGNNSLKNRPDTIANHLTSAWLQRVEDVEAGLIYHMSLFATGWPMFNFHVTSRLSLLCSEKEIFDLPLSGAVINLNINQIM